MTFIQGIVNLFYSSPELWLGLGAVSIIGGIVITSPIWLTALAAIREEKPKNVFYLDKDGKR